MTSEWMEMELYHRYFQVQKRYLLQRQLANDYRQGCGGRLHTFRVPGWENKRSYPNKLDLHTIRNVILMWPLLKDKMNQVKTWGQGVMVTVDVEKTCNIGIAFILKGLEWQMVDQYMILSSSKLLDWGRGGWQGGGEGCRQLNIGSTSIFGQFCQQCS